MTDVEKLNWLVLGRPPGAAGDGGQERALLSAAASALFAGQVDSASASLMQSFGIDEISLRPGQDSSSILPRETVAGTLRSATGTTAASDFVAIGKRLSDDLISDVRASDLGRRHLRGVELSDQPASVVDRTRGHDDSTGSGLLDRVRLTARYFQRSRDSASLSRASTQRIPVVGRFLFPERRFGLQIVHHELTRSERVAAMRAGRHHQHNLIGRRKRADRWTISTSSKFQRVWACSADRR